MFSNSLKHALLVTIFGYSGPKTDKEAIAAMTKAWGDKKDRNFEQLAFITRQSRDEITENWSAFIHTHHYEMNKNLYKSRIGFFPRRSAEAFFSAYLMNTPLNEFPIPRRLGFDKIWAWYSHLGTEEDNVLE